MIFGGITTNQSKQLTGEFARAIELANTMEDREDQRLAVTLIGLAALIVVAYDNPNALQMLAAGIEAAADMSPATMPDGAQKIQAEADHE